MPFCALARDEKLHKSNANTAGVARFNRCIKCLLRDIKITLTEGKPSFHMDE
jgi:hypothetical protein